MFLKKKFLLSGIQTQITYGVLCVSVCITLLVFALLGIYSFVILNLSYSETIFYFEELENSKIENIIDFIFSQFELHEEFSRMQIQIIRNFLDITNENYSQNILRQEFIFDQFIEIDHKGDLISRSSCQSSKCFYFFNPKKKNKEQLLPYFTMLTQLIPVFEVNHNIIFPYLDNSNSYIKNFSFMFNNNIEDNDYVIFFAYQNRTTSFDFNSFDYRNYLTYLNEKTVNQTNLFIDSSNFNNDYLKQYINNNFKLNRK